jgi:DNA-binding response OmpR family regulator
MNAKILIVDDENDLLELLRMTLSAEGYTIRTAGNGAEALAAIEQERPDLILLDIMLGDVSGINLTGKLKNSPETSDIPVILLTAKDTDTDMVVGLRIGADDYVTKPFSTQVLVARIEAVLRRTSTPSGQAGEALYVGPLRIIPKSRQVYVDGLPIDLTGGEYNILMALIQAEGNIYSRKQLKEALGEGAGGQKERIVEVHIAALRKKLGKARKIIKTVHGRGYRINP